VQDKSCLSRAACRVRPYKARDHCGVEISLNNFRSQEETDRKQGYEKALMGCVMACTHKMHHGFNRLVDIQGNLS